jgi:hypothetical protein
VTRTMYDAAYPPPDPHLDVCAFYIGGDTPHVWSDSEIAAQSARWRLPIYACSNPASRNPTSDSAAAVAWLRAHGVPRGSALALDYETAVDAGYLTTFDKEVVAAGWRVLVYGSLSSVTQNPQPSAGFWTASWTGAAHLDPGAAATQWASDTMLAKPYDLSQVADSLVLWDTKLPVPAPGPGPDLYLMENSMLPQIESLASDTRSPGSKGQYAYGLGALGDQGSITFSADGGLNGNQTAAELRVVCWNASGFHVSNVQVGYPAEHRVQVMFPTDSQVYAVTVSRTDDGDFPVGVAVP